MKKKKFFLFTFLYISFFLITVPFWFKSNFGNVHFDQFLFHIYIFFQGNLVGDAQVQKSLYKWIIFVTTGFFIIYLYLRKKFFLRYLTSIKFESLFFLFFIFLSLHLNTNFFKNVKFTENTFIDNNYIETEVIFKKNKSKENLILIYVESLDNIFSNESIYGSNLLSPISSTQLGGYSVKDFFQITGYEFTINALVSTQCGIPAKPFGFFSGSELKNIKSFLPNIKCLTDYTYENNYTNIFVSSDNIKNFGAEDFLKNHKYNKIFGLNELKDLGYKTSPTAWRANKEKGGIHDDVLFEAAFSIIENEYKNKDNPFFISIFSLDTHSPRGYPNPKCLIKKFKDQNIINNYEISHSVACTVGYIQNFINKIKELKINNLNIIIMGDHTFPLNKNKSNIFNNFISHKELIFNRETMSSLDIFPTALNLLDFQFNNNKIALGYSLFGKIDVLEYNNFIENIDSKLLGNSKKYNSFWKNIK
jgi:phosphoglycerol transferase